MATDKPSLELHAEIDTADGLAQYRWGATEKSAEDRPQGIACSSTLMNGYAQGSCSLPRHINKDYGDLGLFDTIRFVGADGRIAYEGRGSRFPREASTVHRANVEAVGWMAHTKDRKIIFLGLDSDTAGWGQLTMARQTALQAGGLAPRGSGEVLWDKTLSMSYDGAWVAGEIPFIEAMYDAGPGQAIGAIYYSSINGINVGDTAGGFIWAVYAADDTLQNGAVGTGSLAGAPANAGIYTVTSGTKRYGFAQFWWGAGVGGGADGTHWNLDWDALQVIGNHGLPLQGTGPYGLLGSDLIKHVIGLGAPLLDTTNVLPTAHPIDQFVFKDLTYVYDMALIANQYERWNLAVWDDKKLYYEPLPDVSSLQSADWVLRSDHKNGLTRSFDGATTDGQANGVIVRFQNILTGAAEMIDPTTNPELADTNTQLAANRAGIRVWEPIQLPNPNSPAGAAKIGVAALAEFNRRRTPSRASIRGHLQDSAGNWHQGWVPRAGDTIMFPEDEDDPIRIAYEVSWNHDSRELTINADAASKTIDAILADQGLQ